MKATLVGYGSLGDLLPLIALAVALRDAGHEVVTVADEAGSAIAERHGLEFHALAGSLHETLQPEGSLALAIDAGRFTLKSFRDHDAHDEARLSLIQRVAQGSDVVVGMPMAHYHAFIAAREVRARPVLGVLQPLAPTRDMAPAGLGMPRLPRWLRRPVGRAVQSAGWLSARGPINQARRDLTQSSITADPTRDAFTLCAWSPALLPQPDDWPASRFAVTGRWHLPSVGWTPDPELAAFLDAGEPPVYVGFGSMQSFSGRDALLDALLGGLTPRRVLLAVDTGRALPGHVHRVTGFVPHDWLFPRCAAIVHHCGAGTSHEAAASGVPSIPVPITMDQPFWADRLHRLGVAAKPLNPRRPDVELVRQAAVLVESDGVRHRATRLAALLAADPGPQAAVAYLEGLS
ncbi:MAG: glycosyltransferase [Propionicimonas sp.]|nr:glycosyltransferase [Propionicimonas sp.]